MFDEALNWAGDSLSTAAAIPVDQARYTTCLLVNIALGWVFTSLPLTPNGRHAFSIVLSGYFSWYLFRATCLHAMGVSALTYVMMAVLPRRYSHHVVFVFTMGYLSTCHIYRMMTDWMGWKLDFTGPQMVITLKLIMVAVNYSHGDPARQSTKSNGKVSGGYTTHAIRDLPSLLEFFGYAFCFTTFLAGPVIEYDTYISYIHKENPGENTSGRAVATLLRLGWFVLCAGVFVVMGPLFPLSTMSDPEFAHIQPLFHRLVFGYLASLAVSFKYYTGWFLSEASCVACGMGYNGVDRDGRRRWDKCTNARVRKIVFAQNVKGFTDNWNIGVANFLRDYVYLRLQAGGVSQNLCTVITQVLCAFWHGFYPSYLAMFLSLTGFVTVARGLRRGLRHHFVRTDAATGVELGGIYPGKYIYDLMGFFLITVGVQYSMGMFQMLSYENTVVFCNNSSWIGHLAIGSLLLLTWVLPKPPRKARPVEVVEVSGSPAEGKKQM